MARGPRERSAPDRIVVVDKPAGMTSHDVVAAARRALGTRRIGHAGTLDPMATGVLVLGVERATRLLQYVSGTTKTYDGRIRLGASTTTDDAQGAQTCRSDTGAVTDAAIQAAVPTFVGEIRQRPSAVSAIKLDGRRAYARVRAGESVELAERSVTVGRFDILAIHRDHGYTDLDVMVTCSAGTYVRALARDLGTLLGVGGHLTMLRRTSVGPFELADAVPVADLEVPHVGLAPADAIGRLYPLIVLSTPEEAAVRTGSLIPADAVGELAGLVGAHGQLLAVARYRDGRWQPEVVLAP